MAVIKKTLNELIGKNIADARRMRNMTQQTLADKIGVTNQFISDAERGVVGCSLETIRGICFALNVSADMLLFAKPSANYNAVLGEKLSSWSVEELDTLSQMTDFFINKTTLKKNNP